MPSASTPQAGVASLVCSRTKRNPIIDVARDVAYYLDAYPRGALSEKEIRMWANYVPLSAIHTFGLSEERPFHIQDLAPLNSLGSDSPRSGLFASRIARPQKLSRCCDLTLAS